MNPKTKIDYSRDGSEHRFILYADGEFAGNVVLLSSVPEDVRKKLSPEFHSWLYVSGLYVSAEYRGKGFEVLLINEAKEFARREQRPLLALASSLEKDRFSSEKLARFYQMHGIEKLNICLENCMGYQPDSRGEKDEPRN